MMLPINVAEVTQSVVDMLISDARLVGVTVERSEEVNKTPNSEGWVGIYRAGIKYVTRAIGAGVGRQQQVSLVVLTQRSDMRSGKDCEDALEDLNQRVLSVILTDESLKGTVDALDPNNFEIRYESYNKIGNLFMQTSAIYLTGLVRVGVQ